MPYATTSALSESWKSNSAEPSSTTTSRAYPTGPCSKISWSVWSIPADPDRRTAVIFADVDNLHRVNETFGLDVGDRVVGTVSARLTELIRGADLLARYGGVNFTVVLPDVSDEFEPVVFASRMLACFSEPINIDDHRVRITGSVGIAVALGRTDGREVLRSAEIALHRAKEAGGGRFAAV